MLLCDPTGPFIMRPVGRHVTRVMSKGFDYRVNKFLPPLSFHIDDRIGDSETLTRTIGRGTGMESSGFINVVELARLAIDLLQNKRGVKQDQDIG